MTDAAPSQSSYAFAGFQLDPVRRELTYRGELRNLRPKSFDVLCFLIENAGEVVSREQLLTAVWRGAVVTDDAVTQSLIDIRRALDDRDQGIIKTVPRRGYRFDARLEPRGNVRADAAGRGWLWPTLAVALTLLFVGGGFLMMSERRSSGLTQPFTVAVLPMRDLSAAGDKAYIAEGLSEELIGVLGRVESLRVIARTSSFGFRDDSPDLEVIAEELGVSHVLAGSVRATSNAMRVSVHLLSAADGAVVWSAAYDKGFSAEGIFDIQLDIAESVVSSLRLPLKFTDKGYRLAQATDNLAALQAYFAGRQHLATRRAAEIEKAIDQFERATAEDPSFALAWASLADAHRLSVFYGRREQGEAFSSSRNAIDRALALNPELGETYASLGSLLKYDSDLSRAETAFLRAIEFSPNYAPAYQWYGEMLGHRGRATEGAALLRIALTLDPRSAIIRSDFAEMLAITGDVDGALREYEAALRIDPEFAVALWDSGFVLHRGRGEIARAIDFYERAIQVSPGTPNPRSLLAAAYIDLGMTGAAKKTLGELLTLAPDFFHAKTLRLQVNLLAGARERAVVEARDTVRMARRYPLALRLLRDESLRLGRAQEALARYEAFSSRLRPDAEVVPEELGLYADYAFALDAAGDSGNARRLARELLVAINSQPREVGFRLHEMRAHLVLGEEARALEVLEEAIEAGCCWRWRTELVHDDALEAVQTNPRWQAAIDALEARMRHESSKLNAPTAPGP